MYRVSIDNTRYNSAKSYMAKRVQGVSPKRFVKHPHKTAKRLAAKKVMLAAKKKKRS